MAQWQVGAVFALTASLVHRLILTHCDVENAFFSGPSAGPRQRLRTRVDDILENLNSPQPSERPQTRDKDPLVEQKQKEKSTAGKGKSATWPKWKYSYVFKGCFFFHLLLISFTRGPNIEFLSAVSGTQTSRATAQQTISQVGDVYCSIMMKFLCCSSEKKKKKSFCVSAFPPRNTTLIS